MRRLLMRLGFKPYLRCCPLGAHDWRRTYGDERLHCGAQYVCERCPARRDGPLAEGTYRDPTQDRINEWRKAWGYE